MAKKDETFIASLHTKNNIERKVNSAFLKGALLFCFLLNIALCITKATAKEYAPLVRLGIEDNTIVN